MNNNMNEEVWKDVVDHEGIYQVSNLGRVRSLDRIAKHGNRNVQLKGKMLKIWERKDGYVQVSLYKNKKQKNHLVHRLVALAFLENPNEFEYINHKNEIKTDNRVENLEWCDFSYNINYGKRNEKMTNHKNWIKKQKEQAKRESKAVIGKNLKTGETIEFSSTREAGRNGFHQGHVAAVCRGEAKTHKGYVWRYK